MGKRKNLFYTPEGPLFLSVALYRNLDQLIVFVIQSPYRTHVENATSWTLLGHGASQRLLVMKMLPLCVLVFKIYLW